MKPTKLFSVVAAVCAAIIFVSCGAFGTKAASDGPTVPKVTGKSYLVSSEEEFNTTIKSAKGGDEVVLAKAGDWSGVDLVIANSGEQDRPIVVRAETNGEVNLTQSSTISVGADWIHISGLSFNTPDPKSKKGYIISLRYKDVFSTHVTVSNCSFDGCSADDHEKSSTWLQIYGSDHTIEYCYVANKENFGMCLTVNHYDDHPNNTRIYRNFFYRPFTYKNQANKQEIMRIGGTGINSNHASLCNTTIEENVFYKCDGEIEIISLKSSGNTVRNNLFLECKGALTIRRGGKITIYGNYFIGNGVENTGGIRITHGGHKIYNNYFSGLRSGGSRSAITMHMGFADTKIREYFPCKDILIANNTIEDCTNAFYLGANTSYLHHRGTVSPDGINITGNVIVRNGEESLTQCNEEFTYEGVHFNNNLEVVDGEPADFTRSMMSISGVDVAKYVSKVDYTAPELVTTDISGVKRSNPTPMGAIADGAATPSKNIPTLTNCGPSWNWVRPE